jgi:hypothetical protein
VIGGREVAIAPPPKVPTAETERFEAPEHLDKEERDVWNQQAPHAFAYGTLTRATMLAFVRYCQVVVLEQHESKSSGKGGANHRGILRQINAYELQFMLTPCGKPVPLAPGAVSAAQDEDDEFFGGPRAIVGR